jgi:hypothetical protein
MRNFDDEPPAPTSERSGTSAVGAVIRILALALAAGLLAGAIAWGIGEAVLVPEVGLHSPKRKINIDPSVAGIRNGIICFVALGATIGLGMGLTGGLIGRSGLRASIAGVIGLLLGGGAGGALSWLILPVFYKQPPNNDLIYSLMVHGGVWVGVGAAAGLAFGIGLGERNAIRRGLISGAGFALLATVIYEFAGPFLFPFGMIDRPISHNWESRLAARLLVTVLIAVGVVVAADWTSLKKRASEFAA